MSSKKFISFVLPFIFILIIFFANRLPKTSQSSIPLPSRSSFQPSFSSSSSSVLSTTPPVSCSSVNGLPDPNCTPGAADPRVTQDNVNQTICVTGYTKTVRPPVSYTEPLKLEQIKEYRYTDTNPRDYEEDHLIPLEVGGSPADPKNLWPELGASPNSKDKIESLCHEKVCSGQLTLQEAQKEIATNWHTACQ